MKKRILWFFDLVLGGLLIALVGWPLRLYRAVRGPCDRGPAFLRMVCALFLYFACYAALFEVTARGVRLLQGRSTEPSWRYVDDRFLYAFHPFRAMQLRAGAEVREGDAGRYGAPGVDYVVNEHGGRGPALAPRRRAARASFASAVRPRSARASRKTTPGPRASPPARRSGA